MMLALQESDVRGIWNLLIVGMGLAAGAAQAAAPACDAAWQRQLAVRLGDDAHGPDRGSAEWRAAVSRRLGLADAPQSASAWCARVQQALVEARRAPSCRKRKTPHAIDSLVCRRADLALLDVHLAQAYAAVRHRDGTENPILLATEQHGWQRGRDDCWKAGSTDAARAACVREAYRQRLVELQARYQLVPVQATARWHCDDGSSLSTTFFAATDPPSLVAERGDQSSLMLLQPAASGARYAGRNESFWEHQGEARITWGWQAPETRCLKEP